MQFYILEQYPRGDSETCASTPSKYNQGPASRCPVCGNAISMLTWLPPYRVSIELRGKECGDFVFGLHSDDMLVSQVFVDLWRHHQLKGLAGFEPVDVIKVRSRRKDPPRLPQYQHVTIGRDSAALDLKASKMEWLDPPDCMECRASNIIRWQRVVIEQGTWSGADIFVSRGLSGTWIVTPRFKSLCEEYQIKNAVFIPAEEYAYDFYPGLTDPAQLDRFRPKKPTSE